MTRNTLSPRLRPPRRLALIPAGVLVGLALMAYGASQSSAAAHASAKPLRATYRLHMDFFSAEAKLTTVIDPQVFVRAPGAPAAVGPQMIKHAAGLAPARKTADPSTPLLAANGTALHITLGQWEKARGTVTFRCVSGHEKAASRLTGLIPRGRYSTFVVHLKVMGAGRFTPWGDATGTTNNFTASARGTASPKNTVAGCLGSTAAVLIVWHSDGRSHGASPGTIGVTQHNSLITPLP